MSGHVRIQIMTELSIQLLPPDDAGLLDPCRIRIGTADVIFTRLLREPSNQSDDYLLASPAALAFWICDNWWRLRWESIPAGGPAAPWRLAHDLAAIGGGYAWPRLCIWGDVDRIGFLCHSDPVGVVGPVRYLTDALLYVGASAFETEVDAFLDRVADRQRGFGSDRDALRALIAALRTERDDPELARWRRLEARLGFDPDQGPDELVESADTLANRFGLEAVEEALTAVPGGEASRTLERELSIAREQGEVCDFSAVLSAVDPIIRDPQEAPWVAAERTAGLVRAIAGIGHDPLRNKRLADLLGVRTEVFQKVLNTSNRTYGLRLAEGADAKSQSVSLRSRWPQARRFELCRALGDALWSRNEVMGPLTKTSTARQKFQRTFAQSLLCPFEDLKAYLETDHPDEDDIAAAAVHFHVANRVVETVLVNKKLIERERLVDRLEAA